MSRLNHHRPPHTKAEVKRDPATHRPLCPECGTVMGKKERRWSGRNKRQLWLCFHCGRTILLPLDFLPGGDGSKPLASISAAAGAVINPLEGPHRRLCDGKYSFDGEEHQCTLSEDGCCVKPTYPFSCPKYKTREEWGNLPTKNMGEV